MKFKTNTSCPLAANKRTRLAGIRRAMSLLELLASLTIVAVIATVMLPRLGGGASDAKNKSCELRRSVVEVQCMLWKRQNGSFPNTGLSDIGTDVEYFPDGLPVCPVDGSAYKIDDVTGEVTGHTH